MFGAACSALQKHMMFGIMIKIQSVNLLFISLTASLKLTEILMNQLVNNDAP